MERDESRKERQRGFWGWETRRHEGKRGMKEGYGGKKRRREQREGKEGRGSEGRKRWMRE